VSSESPPVPPNAELAFGDPAEEIAESEVDIATQSLARPAAAMAIGTALSRLTGLGRIIALVLALGVAESRLADSYNLAGTLPFVLYELALGGVLTSIFIPVLVQELRTKERREAWESVSALITATLAMLCLLAVITMAAAPLIMDFFGTRLPGSGAAAQESLTTFLLRVFAIQIALYGFTAIAAGLLNAHGRFAVPMFAPIVNNLAVIAAFLLFAAIVPGVPTVEGVERSLGLKLLLGLGATCGVAAMGAVYWPFLRRLPGRIRIRVELGHPAVRKLARLSAWTVVYVAINAVGTVISFYLANQLQGGITAYVTAFAFFQLPIGIAAVSIATALVPKLSAHHVDADLGDFRVRLAGGLKITALLMLPATAAFIVLAEPMVSVLLEHGIVGAESAELVASTLRYFAIGLLPFAAFQLLMRGFYTRQDARTPALINVVEVGVTVAFDFALFEALDVRGLALAHSLGYVAGVAVAAVWLGRQIGSLSGHGIVVETLKVAAAAAAAAAAMLGVLVAVEGIVPGFLRSLVQLVGAGVAGLAAFFASAWLLRVRDLAELERLLPGRR
jgi:putative peptidoglycan lipid II flippase